MIDDEKRGNLTLIVDELASVIDWGIPFGLREIFREHTECKPMRDGGLPNAEKLGAKASTYRPSPNHAQGGKRRRQWR